ncbi:MULTISPECIES: hypothetical protein [Streptosporangiaceae]|uniref:hypothetical protein n=1 Tax=Streptosporangiaceae TaxID=2004 RepID=UPI00340806E4
MSEEKIAERFKRETANHVMEIKHDDGLYRHLRFRNPKRGTYWFDLVTWPGKLSITGDIDGYVFSCAEDVFGFFRASAWQGAPNPTYWDEKVVASRDSVKTFSPDLFNQQVADELRKAERHYPGVTEAWNEKVNAFFAEYNTENEYGALAALNGFEFWPGGDERGEVFRFHDTHDWQLKDYDWSFLWACHAIVWGIAEYDRARSAAVQGGEVA